MCSNAVIILLFIYGVSKANSVTDNDDRIYFENDDTTVTNIQDRGKSSDPTNRPLPTRTLVALSNRTASRYCSRYRENFNPQSVTTHISDGELADEGEFPHIAALGYIDDNESLLFNCGGTLIADKFVLTAAHCIRNKYQLIPVMVRMGVININGELNNAETDYEIKNIVLHPEYKPPSRYNDIALLELARPVKFSENIYPACMYTENNDPSLPFTIAGWGFTTGRASNRSDVLLKAQIDIRPMDECIEEYRGQYNISEGQICARANDLRDGTSDYRDTCPGDSGGPLQITYNRMPLIVGVTSFGNGVCGSGDSGVYTRVSTYLDWIESQVWPQNNTTNNACDSNMRIGISLWTFGFIMYTMNKLSKTLLFK